MDYTLCGKNPEPTHLYIRMNRMLIQMKKDSDVYECIAFCDLEETTCLVGHIVRNEDGYWRFASARHYWVSCKHLQNVIEKLSALNIKGE